MRRFGRATLFLMSSLVFLFAGALLSVLLLPFGSRTRILAHLTRFWAHVMLRITGITVRSERKESLPLPDGMLIVANHQSYLDIVIIASLIPAVFVAKREVREWPLIGWLASLGGTLFIDRTALRNALNVSGEIERTLHRGVNVQVFPEGTSTDGSDVLPFRPFLFRSATQSCRPILPVTINYRTVNGEPFSTTNRDKVCWYGSMTFASHFWKLLALRSVEVSVTPHPHIIVPMQTDPGIAAESSRRYIRGAFAAAR